MDESISQAKKQLRRMAKAHRLGLNMPEISRQIQEQVQQWEFFQAAQSVFIYAALPLEIDLFPLVAQFPGKNWYLPRAVSDTSMVFYQYRPGDLLEKSVYGILEPLETATPWAIKSPPDLMFVPSLMLDRQGRRLGFGKGYYDRFLSSLSKVPVTAGTIVEALIVDMLPQESWDIALQWGIHEAGILKFPL